MSWYLYLNYFKGEYFRKIWFNI